MRRILIDTNIYSYALRGVVDVVEEVRGADEIGICAISIGELLSGFKQSTREKENRKELEMFLDSPRVRLLTITADTGDFYAEIVSHLKKIGRPIPTNDIWIGAAALQYGYKLYSKDKHFKSISGLVGGLIMMD
jgi:tRNA(fMet)-specific endonuclease VapC